VRNLVRNLFTWLQEPVGSRPVELASKPKKKDDKTEWAHGFIPKTPAAARIKDHRAKGSASDAPSPVKGTDDYNQLSAKQRREVDQATSGKEGDAKTAEPTHSRIPPAVWRGRAQRLSVLSEQALKRSLRSKANTELRSLRAVIASINDDSAAKTGPDAGRSFSGLVAAIDAELKSREK
jgi:hypothetical protein